METLFSLLLFIHCVRKYRMVSRSGTSESVAFLWILAVVLMMTMLKSTHAFTVISRRHHILSARFILSNYIPSTTSRLHTQSSSVISDDQQYVVTSLYRFHPLSDDRIGTIVQRGKDILSTSYPSIKGTLLIAKEGINGQFCLPVDMVPEFSRILCDIDDDLFAPVKLNVGLPFSRQKLVQDAFPFKKLLFKHKKEVLTDAIDDLDWNNAGPEVPPSQWHAELLRAQQNIQQQQVTSLEESNLPIILDCRNGYESDVGTFAGAIPLNTDKFSETWDKLDSMLQNIPSDRRILTFCTGGIRCVKVNAYLKQKLGFENIGRLEHGIIAYERWLHEQNSTSKHTSTTDTSSISTTTSSPSSSTLAIPDVQTIPTETAVDTSSNMFRGKNFLFDRRRLMEPPQPPKNC